MGSRNKATIERERIAAAEAAERQLATTRMPEGQTKLAKDVLDDFMQLFAGMAAYYQPLRDGVAIPRDRKPDPALFEKYARLTVETASKLAYFQSPTFKAVHYQFAPTPVAEASPPVPGDTAKVIELRDPKTIHRTYLALVKGR